jgi:hypothetical protein
MKNVRNGSAAVAQQFNTWAAARRHKRTLHGTKAIYPISMNKWREHLQLPSVPFLQKSKYFRGVLEVELPSFASTTAVPNH